MKALALCGSLRTDSATLKAMRIIAEAVEGEGVGIDLLHGDALDLPLYRDEQKHTPVAAVAQLQQLAQVADAFLLGSPEYHGGYSGTLKNALDWLTVEHFTDKPVALVAVAGGQAGAFNTLNALRISIRWVHGWVLPQQVSIGSSWAAFGPDGRPQDARLGERLHQLGHELVRATRLLAPMRTIHQQSPVSQTTDPDRESEYP